ncbi:MAG: glucodextranase DOMON-like domain-containing protein [Deinococcaceae bacterium]
MLTATTLLFSVLDPSGDAYGDGRYILPSDLSDAEKKSLDIRSFAVFDRQGVLEFKIGFARLSNALNSPRRFSTPYLDLFIQTGMGGQVHLADTGFETASGTGWQWHIAVTPYKTVVQRDQRDLTAVESNVQVSVEGSSLVLDTQIPSGSYGYWLTSRVFDPLSQKGYLEPTTETGMRRLFSPVVSSPSPVDVLSLQPAAGLYTKRTLPPVGKMSDPRPQKLLWAGAISLVLTLLASLKILKLKR